MKTTDNDSIINSIAYIAKQAVINEPVIQSVMGTVKSIETITNIDGSISTYCIVTPLDTSLTDISYVQISASDAAISNFPVIGGKVCVNLFDNSSGFISQFGSVTQTILAQGTQNYGGLIIIADLVQKLNALENTVNDLISDLNDLQNAYNLHGHVPAGGTTSTPVLAATPADPDLWNSILPNQLTATTIQSIENPVVIHGNGSQTQSAYETELQAAITSINIYQNVVNTEQERINQYINDNPGQGIPDSLQATLNKALANLQQAKSNLNQLKQNPPQ